MNPQERKEAARALIESMQVMDDDHTFSKLLGLALATGHTSLARDIRLVRVRIDTVIKNAERVRKQLNKREVQS